MRVLLIVAVAGCAGSRLVPPPQTPEGYRAVELRDVAPLGLADVNVQLTAKLGPMGAEEVCGGLVTFPALADDGMPMPGDLTLTIPRSRYAEVRALSLFQRVRVRGYVSTWFAAGCDWFSRTSHRYLWVDTIDPL